MRYGAIRCRSISLPARLARRARKLAKAKRLSANRLLVRLIEQGIESQEHEKRRFFAVAKELMRSTDPRRQQALKEELARMTFGQ